MNTLHFSEHTSSRCAPVGERRRAGAAAARPAQQRVTLLSESDVSEAVVELRGLELDLAGEPRSASHGVEAGGLSSALRRFRSEAWRHQVGPKACAAAPVARTDHPSRAQLVISPLVLYVYVFHRFPNSLCLGTISPLGNVSLEFHPLPEYRLDSYGDISGQPAH